jgi:hypothetical protein
MIANDDSNESHPQPLSALGHSRCGRAFIGPLISGSGLWPQLISRYHFRMVGHHGEVWDLFTMEKYSNSEKMLDFTSSVIMVSLSRSKFEGRLPEAFCRRGTGAAPASEGLTQPSSPGRTRAASSGTNDPARSDHGQRHKGQDAALARRKARVHRCAPNVRRKPDTPPGVIRALRLVGAPSPSISRETEEAECGRPPGPEQQTGADFALPLCKPRQGNAV